ncbi:uncharacterized protein LOC122655165 [Telopea speciosissima]|uniref:uncharacterized protein LOC122655165 n=1 Tax=Telopea speciosissima TaxID=54955 RepID=UPI001CC4AED9|nr:uncharacterized protein LOC122655165 [Telopea speciosissima]
MADDNIGSVDGGKDFNLHSVFENIKQFRSALQEFTIKGDFNILRLKNERKRVTAICASDGCSWREHASLTSDGITFMIKLIGPAHTCATISSNSNATSGWIEKLLSARLREESVMSIKTYCEMLLNKNPDSVVLLHPEVRHDFNEDPTFQRLFICLDAYKKAFVSGYRPFIGLDGCHLKGRYGGIMLSVVSVDGKNYLFFLAFAIVEVENTATWEFFLHSLADALQDSMDYMNLTFMTDKQKGLIHAINNIFSGVHQRTCCRHLYNNFKASFPGLLLKSLFWKAAQVSSAWVYERAIEKMKDTNVEAHDWLLSNPPSTWSRHAFDTGAKCDHVTNNMIESFNNWIGPMRNKTILSLIDDIRAKVMIRLRKKYIFACSLEGKVTPSVKKKLKLIVSDARFCHTQIAGENQYEVTDGSTRFTVNLSTKHCDCEVWRISGIPCKHAAACIRE